MSPTERLRPRRARVPSRRSAKRARGSSAPLFRPLWAAFVVFLALLVLAAVYWAALPDVGVLKTKRPLTTALIEQRKEEAAKAGRKLAVRQTWVPLEQISPKLHTAVVLSEDAAFWGHEGVDWFELKEAVREDLRTLSFRRGASTITQQLAKNLYYGTRKSLMRKLNELFVTVKLEQTLTKKQILAIYLNVIEWGDGIFGVEAAARRHFGVSASQLNAAQASMLAAMLPAPRRSNVDAASPWLRRRSLHVLRLLRATQRITEAEHAVALADLERRFAGAAPGPEEIPEDDDAPAPASVRATRPQALDAAPPFAPTHAEPDLDTSSPGHTEPELEQVPERERETTPGADTEAERADPVVDAP